MSAVTHHRPWEDAFWVYFRLARKGWTPPKSIRVCQTRRGMIIKAVFITEGGDIARSSVMLRKHATGGYVIADEGLKIRQRLPARQRPS